MNMKRIISLMLALVVLASAMTLTGCDMLNELLGGGATGGNEPTGKNTLLMEAEYTFLDDVKGNGLSDNTAGLSMIYGNATEAQKEMWSNGYYVGYMYNTETLLTFEFNSSAATTATVTFSFACEHEDLALVSSQNLDILVNGEAQYFQWSVAHSDMSEAEFANTYKLTVNLVEGANKIEIDIIEGMGLLLDCVKVVASDATVELSWNALTDNPDRRDNEV